MSDFKNELNPLVYELGKMFVNDQGIKKLNEFNQEEQENLENLKIYLYIIILVFNNEEYLDQTLHSCTNELKNIKLIKNESNYTVGKNNRKIIKTIRNSFVHSSGKITIENDKLTISNDTIPNNPKKNKNTTIIVDKKDLLELLKKTANCIKNKDNEVIKKCFSFIDDIEKKERIIGRDYGYILLLSSLFSYNKESIYDKYMDFINYSLDFTNVKVSNTKLLTDESQRNIKLYYEDNNMVFKTLEDRITHKKELLKLAKKGYFIENSNSNRNKVWDPRLMTKDTELDILIPNDLLMEHIRNSVSHGLIEFKDNIIVFTDSNKKDGKYFRIEMPYETVKSICLDNYFEEGSKTFTQDHEKMSNRTYRTQLIIMKQGFPEYFLAYKDHFPSMSEEEVLDYMIENHKISNYLYENPESIPSFYRTVLQESHKPVIEYICDYYGVKFNDGILLKGPEIEFKDIETGIKNYSEWLKNKDNTYLLSQLLYYKNRCSFDDEETLKKEIMEEDLTELESEQMITSLYLFENHDLVEQLILGNYINNTNELERILCAHTYRSIEVSKMWHNKDYDENEKEQLSIYDESSYLSEGKTVEEINKYFEKHKILVKLAFYKAKIRMNMLNIFKNKNINLKIGKILDKLLLRRRIDRVAMMYMTAQMYREKDKKKGDLNGKNRK